MKLKGVYLEFVRTAALDTQIQEALELCSARLKKGGVYKGKNHKITVGYMSCLSRIIIGAGKKWGRLLSQGWLGTEMVV